MPNLDPAALWQQIKSRTLGELYVLVGEDTRRMESLLDGIEATIDPADRPFAVERLYAEDAGGSPVDIAAAARILPMLGDRRIVIVLRAERLLKPKRAARAGEDDAEGETPADAEGGSGGSDLAALEDYVASPVPFSTLVFAATEMDRSRRFTKKLLQAASVVVLSGLHSENRDARRELSAAVRRQISEEVTAAGRVIDPDAVALLVERAGGEINRLRGDVERLLLYTEGQGRITRADVDEVASGLVAIEDEWAITNALADGDAPRALGETGLRLERGDSPHALLGQLRWWVSNRLAPADPERARRALDLLLRTDLALKSSGGDDRVLVERLVMELVGARVPGFAPGRR